VLLALGFAMVKEWAGAAPAAGEPEVREPKPHAGR
jgi:hypothetical protein